MGRFNSLLSIFTIFIVAFTFVEFTLYRDEAIREANEYNLDLSVNYAVDAAVEEMLINSTDLKLDYADFESVSVDPEVALETYCEVLLENLGWGVTDENIQMIKGSCTPCFLVACYDGYYVGTPTEINAAGVYDIVFSEKKPYYYEATVDGHQRIYALNLGTKDCKYIDLDSGAIFKDYNPLSETETRVIINTQISKDFMSTVYQNNHDEIDLRHEIFIPDRTTTVTRANSVLTPSVLAYVNNIWLGAGEPLESFAIGGARLTHTEYMGTYTDPDTGRPSYCPVRLKTPEISFTHIYEKPEYAAERGYYADITRFKAREATN